MSKREDIEELKRQVTDLTYTVNKLTDALMEHRLNDKRHVPAVRTDPKDDTGKQATWPPTGPELRWKWRG
jgi:hypothetical protein